MSGVRAPHLQRRDGVYYLQLGVPDALRPLVGKTEIVKSLRTASLRIARPRSALLTALVMAAFEVIKTTDMTTKDAKRLPQGCLVQAIAKQEEEPRFVPKTDDWDYEFGEQHTLAEDRIAELDGQTVSEKYDGEVLKRVRGLLARNGISHHDISEARFKDLANSMARIPIEQQKLFLARIEDRFAAYAPFDPLFVQIPQNYSGMAPTGIVGSAFHGPNLGDAIQTYLNANKNV